MARRKGETRISTLERGYPFRALVQLHFPRIPSEVKAEQAAAAAISNGDYRTSQPFRIESGLLYLFRAPDQAHAMQIWLEAHARVYEPWIDRVKSHEATCRRMKEIADLVNGAAATGATQRLMEMWRAQGYEAAVELCREIEPGISRMDAKSAIELIAHYRRR